MKKNPPELERDLWETSDRNDNPRHISVNSEIISEYAKRCGIISTYFLDYLCEYYLDGQKVQDLSLDETIMFFKDLKNQRLEFEYFGCHIPESLVLREPIPLLKIKFSSFDFCGWKASNMEGIFVWGCKLGNFFEIQKMVMFV